MKFSTFIHSPIHRRSLSVHHLEVLSNSVGTGEISHWMEVIILSSEGSKIQNFGKEPTDVDESELEETLRYYGIIDEFLRKYGTIVRHRPI